MVTPTARLRRIASTARLRTDRGFGIAEETVIAAAFQTVKCL
jgi:hypothetical protein